MRFFVSAYNTFLWSMLLAFIMFKNVWLEMRINIGAALFVLWILFFIIFYKLFFIKNIIKFSVINFTVFIIISLIILTPYKISSIPSSIIREGLHLTRILSLNIVNAGLIVFIITGILFIVFFKKDNK